MKFRTPEDAAKFLREGIARDYLYSWDAKTIVAAITMLPLTEEYDPLKQNSFFYAVPPTLRIRASKPEHRRGQ